MKKLIFLAIILLLSLSQTAYATTADEYYQSGTDKFTNKDYPGAIADYTKAIELNPKNPDYYWKRGNAKSWLSDWAGQLIDETRAVSLSPNNQTYTAARDQARANVTVTLFGAIDSGDEALAANLLESGIDTEIKNENKHTFLSYAVFRGNLPIIKLLIAKGADVNAKGMYDRTPLHGAVTMLYLNEDKYIEIAKYLIAHGANINAKDSDVGNTPLHMAAGSWYNPKMAKLLISKGADLTIKNDKGNTPLEGIDADRKESITNPEAYALFNSGTEKFKNKDYKGAIADYTKAIKLNPKNPDYYTKRGNAKSWIDDYKGDLEDQNTAISLNPNEPDYYYNRGIAKGWLKDQKGAVADYHKALALARQIDHLVWYYKHLPLVEKAEHPEAYGCYESGLTKHNAGNYAAAIADYTKAIALSPNYADYYHTRGNAKSWLNDWQGDIDDQNRAISIDSKPGEYYYSRGVAKSYLGDKAGQLADYNSAIEYAPPTQIDKYIKERDKLKEDIANSRQTTTQQGGQDNNQHQRGDDASYCAMKWGNSVTNSCNQTIRVHTTGNAYCTGGTMTIGPKQQGFINCTDVNGVWVDSAVFE